MGIFKTLFGRPADSIPAAKPATAAQPACKTQQELIERYGAIAFDKQLRFAEAIGHNNWNVDMPQGTISFGNGLVFPMQILGTISHANQSWLWAWANTQSGLSVTIIQQSLELKNYGEENGIDLLKNDSVDFSKDGLHLIGLIASGMFHSSGYYLADYGQGTMLVTIKSNMVDETITHDQHRILTVFPQFIAQFDTNHKSALANYLPAKGYAVTENDRQVTGSKNGDVVTGEFDAQSRLTNLAG